VPQWPTRYAVRTPTHKLIETVDDGTTELYDLAHDPREQRNVLEEAAAARSALGARLAAARELLGQRGFQVRVVGTSAGQTRFRLTVGSPQDTGFFGTLDRRGAAPDTRLGLSSDGRTLTITGTTDSTGRTFRFDRPLRRFIKLAGGADPMTITLEVDGVRAPDDAVRLGEHGQALAGGQVASNDPVLAADAPPPCPAPESGVRAYLWRYPEGLAPATPAAPDESARERLRALGYVQ
jgi:hypothetical protein